jgi:hypothetical protein
MSLPLHLGLEHAGLWVVVTVLAFVAGLGVNLYRSRRSDPSPDPVDESES